MGVLFNAAITLCQQSQSIDAMGVPIKQRNDPIAQIPVPIWIGADDIQKSWILFAYTIRTPSVTNSCGKKRQIFTYK